ncbi:MaoC family dehydratase [Alloalcanivorax xenomutans]|uniref:MaoC family dehydratase n=1 Tax=Alloalcanivorax xenomutans TaxID=1094342 RepID=UPI0009B637F0|nr:MaoC family dehydratase [Alloalcanivorax xenomutans]ARB45973.1 acyl dehydratase [Alloalcanivorax xenomutans]MCE7522043.1 MaoC family dehydratase [Alloalcanivorax xenomutans]
MSYPIAELTGKDNYFEDFTVGDVYKHARGRTITEMDNVLITLQVMNTAQGHFNEHRMQESPFKHRINFGGITASFIIGLASEDTGEQVIEELGLNAIRFSSPVLHGHTLYAYTEVLKVEDAEREDAGIVTFRHLGFNQDDIQVFSGERKALIKRRSYWGDK